ncbi:MAG: 50S ribosomal protein L29 [Candidatus Aenigmarchaeota archaeon]|nr:50S ribosomal protein L29 [Candidatus Aenigmarchaeota archaeon]
MKSKASIKDMSVEELNKKLSEYRLELAKQKGKSYMGVVPDNPGNIKKMKKDVARIHTVLKLREKKS